LKNIDLRILTMFKIKSIVHMAPTTVIPEEHFALLLNPGRKLY
jgi:hypothetical protein